MASFPDLWPHRPSDTSEGFGTFRVRLVAAVLSNAAHAIAIALSELATQGSHAVRSMPKHMTGARLTPQAAVLSVGASAVLTGGESRG